ncbi:MAG: RnfABCDGE type electron transport complex subunit D [Gammaproteobacteria bacterium]|nr:RnfABCDGE type electron transport complex subunit D [Gammaproteobacteria bacterium]
MVTKSTTRIMWTVNAALLPGLLVLSYYYGWGYVANLAIALPVGLALEVVCLKARGQQVTVTDGSAVTTTLILALALPPNTPGFVIAIAMLGAIVLAKHLYGGLGHNVFNPAMVGYALVLVSFPQALASWPLLGPELGPALVDANTGATVLTTFKYREGLTVLEIWQPEAGFGYVGGLGWEWANGGFLLGGLYLCWRRLIAWRVAAGMLLALGLLAILWYDGGSSASAGSPLFHWLSAGTMLAAFFVVTDPVTHPNDFSSQWLFGLLVGTLTFVIRTWGSYPDGIAFAVIVANAATPYLNHVFRRRHAQATG